MHMLVAGAGRTVQGAYHTLAGTGKLSILHPAQDRGLRPAGPWTTIRSTKWPRTARDQNLEIDIFGLNLGRHSKQAVLKENLGR